MMHAMSTARANTRSDRSDRAVALVEAELRQVEARLAERMESPIGPIPKVGAHLLDAGGKRLRPLLAGLAARAPRAPPEAAPGRGRAPAPVPTATPGRAA